MICFGIEWTKVRCAVGFGGLEYFSITDKRWIYSNIFDHYKLTSNLQRRICYWRISGDPHRFSRRTLDYYSDEPMHTEMSSALDRVRW